jgi:hypothetical protein
MSIHATKLFRDEFTKSQVITIDLMMTNVGLYSEEQLFQILRVLVHHKLSGGQYSANKLRNRIIALNRYLLEVYKSNIMVDTASEYINDLREQSEVKMESLPTETKTEFDMNEIKAMISIDLKWLSDTEQNLRVLNDLDHRGLRNDLLDNLNRVITFLLVTSGRRIVELMESVFLDRGDVVVFEVRKRKKVTYERFLPLIPAEQWNAIYEKVKPLLTVNVASTTKRVNEYIKWRYPSIHSSKMLRKVYLYLMERTADVDNPLNHCFQQVTDYYRTIRPIDEVVTPAEIVQDMRRVERSVVTTTPEQGSQRVGGNRCWCSVCKVSVLKQNIRRHEKTKKHRNNSVTK